MTRCERHGTTSWPPLPSDVWEWRARQQPSMGDDIPRLPRPPGWLPDFSAEAVAVSPSTT